MNVFRSVCSSFPPNVAAIENLSSGDAIALLGFGDLEEYTLDPADFKFMRATSCESTISSVFLSITFDVASIQLGTRFGSAFVDFLDDVHVFANKLPVGINQLFDHHSALEETLLLLFIAYQSGRRAL